jgi:hypothetical protein
MQCVTYRPLVGRKPKLTPAQVGELRRTWHTYRTVGDAARAFGISSRVLKSYVKGEHKRVYA